MKVLSEMTDKSQIGLAVRTKTFQTICTGHHSPTKPSLIKYEYYHMTYRGTWEFCYDSAVGDIQRFFSSNLDGWRNRFE